jgi:hypothetical protein
MSKCVTCGKVLSLVEAVTEDMRLKLNDAERKAAWEEIEQELSKFEGPGGFEGPFEMVIAVGIK